MIPLLIGLGIGIIGTVVALAYWDDIVDWLNDFIPRLEAAWNEFKQSIAHAAMMAAEKVKEAGKFIVKIMHKLYYKNEKQQWVEETTTRTVPENEVPPAIRAKVNRQEVEADITEDIERELNLTI